MILQIVVGAGITQKSVPSACAMPMCCCEKASTMSARWHTWWDSRVRDISPVTLPKPTACIRHNTRMGAVILKCNSSYTR